MTHILQFLERRKTKPVVGMVGVPLDYNSSHATGAAKAPEMLVANIFHPSQNSEAENGVDLKADAFADLGNIILEKDTAFEAIKDTTAGLVAAGVKPLFLGGDHSITWPILEGLYKKHKDLTILHIDAHGDLYDDFEGNPWSHASPFARIMEKGLAKHLIQVGIRTMTKHQREQVERYGVECIEMKDWQDGWLPEVSGPIYMTVDLDGIDPAFAPGVSHREPGGLTTRDVLRLINHVGPNLVGADFVEYNPTLDIDNQALMVGVKLVKELAGQMIANDK